MLPEALQYLLFTVVCVQVHEVLFSQRPQLALSRRARFADLKRNGVAPHRRSQQSFELADPFHSYESQKPTVKASLGSRLHPIILPEPQLAEKPFGLTHILDQVAKYEQPGLPHKRRRPPSVPVKKPVTAIGIGEVEIIALKKKHSIIREGRRHTGENSLSLGLEQIHNALKRDKS